MSNPKNIGVPVRKVGMDLTWLWSMTLLNCVFWKISNNTILFSNTAFETKQNTINAILQKLFFFFLF